MKTSKTLYCIVSTDDALKIKNGENLDTIGEIFDRSRFPMTTLKLKDGERFLTFFGNLSNDYQGILDHYEEEYEKELGVVCEPNSMILQMELPLNVWISGHVGKTFYELREDSFSEGEFTAVKSLAIDPTKLGNSKITGFVFNHKGELSADEVKALFEKQNTKSKETQTDVTAQQIISKVLAETKNKSEEEEEREL